MRQGRSIGESRAGFPSVNDQGGACCRQHSILQIRSQIAQGDGGKINGQTFAAVQLRDQLGAQRIDSQQNTMAASQPGRDRVGQLHLVELLVTPQADQQRLAVAILEAGQQQQHLDQLAGIESMGVHQLLDRGLARGGQDLAAAPAPQPPWQLHGRGRQGHRPLLVGGIASVGTGENEVLARVGGDHELLAGGAADRTAVGFHGHGFQSAAAEDAPVGLIHGRIGLAQ